jgi:Beta-propeller repeat
VFAIKLLPTGNGLVYGTYVGGRSDEHGKAIAVDSAGSAYITGDTFSPDFPTVSAFQPASGGNQDAFVTKLNSSGGLAYSSYLGGSGGIIGLPETGAGIGIDTFGNAYITGTTSSFNFPLVNALQATHTGSQPDAFIAKVNPSGTSLLYSTYLGGSSVDVATAISVDGSGMTYIAGYTASVDFPSPNFGDSFNNGAYDGFLVQVSADGNLLQSMCFGGSSNDVVNALSIKSGAAYLTGQTLSGNFPAVHAVQSSAAGSMDGFLARIVLPVYAPPPAAVFLKMDTTTQGFWKSAYGANGFVIANDSANYPSYAQVSINSSTATWSPSTNDVRAVQKSTSTDRIASSWYGWTSITIDVNLTDGQSHQLALYSLDWDQQARSEIIKVTDAATGSVLDSRSVSAFGGGQYAVWSLTGHVAIQITRAAGPNAVLSGIFFGGGMSPTSTAAFQKSDATTQGSWKAVYGANGFAIANDSTNYPSYAQVSVNTGVASWIQSTSDMRALQKSASPDRIASIWYGWTNISIDVNLTDGQPHQFALYCLDWDQQARVENVRVTDALTGSVLDDRVVSGFSGGQYLVWNMSGHVIIQITRAAGPNAVLSGIFFGGATTSSARAVFLKTDQTTQGTWKPVYGGSGLSVANDSTNYPSFAQITVNSAGSVNWVPSTDDVRALQKTASSDRIASLWYSFTSITIDLNLTDGQSHQVALYCLDWDRQARTEIITVIDAAVGNVLDSRTVTAFAAGQYAVWTLSGHVIIQITRAAGPNVVLSGIFFGGGVAPAASAVFVKSDVATKGSWKSVYGTAGYVIPGEATNYPAFAQVNIQAPPTVWAQYTVDARALQKISWTDRIASLWYGWTDFAIDVNLTDGKTHPLAIYFLDWDQQARTERVTLTDTLTGAVLDTRTVSAFSDGQYLVWNLSGHVAIQITRTAGPNAVVSGLFF